MKKSLLILFVIFVVFEILADEADKNACKYARKESYIETWASYLKNFPKGMCVKEAETFLNTVYKKTDSELCKQAKKQNTFAAWHDYLQKFPEGKCSFEAKMTLKKQIKITEWSKKSYKTMNYSQAIEYCKNLKEGNHNDWRLPTIDELRTIIKDNPRTEIGGTCKISEQAVKLAETYYDEEECGRRSLCYLNAVPYECHHSKLDDKDFKLISSSLLSNNPDWMWYVDFYDGTLGYNNKSLILYSVRCVR